MTKTFQERGHYAEKNRRSAADMHTTITKMYDNTWGTTIFWESFFMSLNRDELVRLAGMIVHDIDELDRRNNRPPRTITRSYQNRGTNSV